MKVLRITAILLLLLVLALAVALLMLGRTDDGRIHPIFGAMQHLTDDPAALEASLREEINDPEALNARRKFVERFYKLAMPTAYGGNITEAEIDTGDRKIPVRVYRPSDADDLPVLLYFFGGGWIFGSIDAVDGIAKYISKRAQVVVISVGYRLAPEHPFPAAIDDAYTALLWANANAILFGCYPDKLAVAGDSAGGNIAAVLTLLARDREGPQIGFQGLIYPITNAQTLTTASGEPLTTLSAYAPGQDLANPQISPLLANSHDNLPPGVVITAQYDDLREDGENYANKLKATGIDIEHHNYSTMGHGFIAMIGIVSAASKALDELSISLRKEFTAPLVEPAS